MSELKVLTKEEVDALLKVSHDESDLSQITGTVSTSEKWSEANCSVNVKSLKNITELTPSECENILTSFLRKKMVCKLTQTKLAKLIDCIGEKVEKHIYCVFQIMPQNCYGMVIIDLPLLHNVINVLYGGQPSAGEPIMESAGKVGMLVAEKLCQLFLDGFVKACGEFGAVTYQVVKTITMPSLTSKLNFEDQVYSIDMSVGIGETELPASIMVVESFFREFIPLNTQDGNHLESNFWRTAIETQVADSFVLVHANLPDVKVKLSDLSNLKSGDLIPISDPTLVYVCLNDLKLFRASAGQVNSKRVAKIVSEI